MARKKQATSSTTKLMSTSSNVKRMVAYRSALGRSRSRTKGASEHTALDKESIDEDLWTMSAVAASRPRLAVAKKRGCICGGGEGRQLLNSEVVAAGVDVVELTFTKHCTDKQARDAPRS